MIPLALADEVAQLLALGQHSQREIARVVGVSRTTVGSIACGRWKPRPVASSPDYGTHRQGRIARCPGCGGRVYLPCLLCRAREHMRVRETRRRAAV